MKNLIKQNKIPLLIGLVVLMAMAAYYFIPTGKNSADTLVTTDWIKEENANPNEAKADEIQSNDTEDRSIIIDVKGAIKNPGVYEVQSGDRVIDIVEKAGGLLDNADRNNVNFAMKLVDEMVLYFPAIGEEISTVTESGVGQADDGKVNLNKASQEDLLTLTGIGPSKAEAIIEYRDQNGPFKEVEELMEISGIGEKTFEKLKGEVTVR